MVSSLSKQPKYDVLPFGQSRNETKGSGVNVATSAAGSGVDNVAMGSDEGVTKPGLSGAMAARKLSRM